MRQPINRQKLEKILIFWGGLIFIVWFLYGAWVDSGKHFFTNFYPKNVSESIETKETLKAKISSLALEKEDFQGVIKASDEYIKRYGDDIDVWIHRGMSYYQLNDCANATASLYHAVQMNIASASASDQDVNDLFSSVLNSKICKK